MDKKTKGKYRDQLEKVDDLAQKLDKTTERPDGGERERPADEDRQGPPPPA